SDKVRADILPIVSAPSGPLQILSAARSELGQLRGVSQARTHGGERARGLVIDAARAMSSEKELPHGKAAGLRIAGRREWHHYDTRRRREAVGKIEIVFDHRVVRQRVGVDVASGDEARHLRRAPRELLTVAGIAEKVPVDERDIGAATFGGAKIV